MTHSDAPSGIESGFEVFGLAETILTAVKDEGFSTPTEIQSGAIPALMTGRDLMGIAQTGGGKTAAFALPVINRLLQDYQKPRQNMPKVLILAPTRELAIQIEQTFVAFSRGSKLRCLVVAGGQPYPPQTTKLRRGVDILVATPGRLIDHIGRKNIKFAETGVFILDEADRMLDMGFIDDVRDLAQSLPDNHQTIMFSATMNPKVRTLSKDLLNDPLRVEIYQKTAVADTIAHRLMNVSRKNKTQLLAELLGGDGVDKVLVFARTKRGADELSKQLYAKGIRSDAIHGDKRQRVREKILMNFRRGRTSVLVATDVAARGIDVDGISHVINYELPIEPENYIHRVGRTGRAWAKGIAISFCDPSDMRLLVGIEKLIKQPIEVDEDHEFHIDVAPHGNSRGNKGGNSRGSKGRFSRDSRGQGGSAGRDSRGRSGGR
ncbi:MAG: DEAD/DEAH box helicase, partial [Alphaproteobacteria bacterium]|nr:DEAD/DEAH box helicase [Alphaproteobacteria bacterium]